MRSNIGNLTRRFHFPMGFQAIENYGVIGNMQSIALVGMNGSIDFLCYPEFDSPTVFAALLDDRKGGCFQIHPQLTNTRVRQLYLPIRTFCSRDSSPKKA
jgi:GH15 family glucan-1,4-alpha-glucosidase